MSLAVGTMPATFSLGVLFTLLAILLASGRVFYALNRQWTTHRPIEALQEWASDRGFRLQLDKALPPALSGLMEVDARIELILTHGSIVLIRLSTAAKGELPRPVWNLLIHESKQSQTPAGLRPVSARESFLDLFSLTGFPSLLPPDRFVVFAIDSKDAKRLAAAPARGLLPADIGLLVHGPYVTMDFSSRPFDAIEFDRMLAIMDQVAEIRHSET
jgi:hypothetical protein